MSALYHEKQSLALCAVHAVNNLLQRQELTKKSFDEVCHAIVDESSWVNPHKSLLGIGNYDVNVVTIILQQQNFEVKWWDQRKELRASDLKDCVGVLWNVPSTSFLGWILRGRHWIALLFDTTCTDNKWVNLDSMLSAPAEVGSHEECALLLNSSSSDSHILLVRQPQSLNDT